MLEVRRAATYDGAAAKSSERVREYERAEADKRARLEKEQGEEREERQRARTEARQHAVESTAATPILRPPPQALQPGDSPDGARPQSARLGVLSPRGGSARRPQSARTAMPSPSSSRADSSPGSRLAALIAMASRDESHTAPDGDLDGDLDGEESQHERESVGGDTTASAPTSSVEVTPTRTLKPHSPARTPSMPPTPPPPEASPKSDPSPSARRRSLGAASWSASQRKAFQGALGSTRNLPGEARWDKMSALTGRTKKECKDFFQHMNEALEDTNRGAGSSAWKRSGRASSKMPSPRAGWG